MAKKEIAASDGNASGIEGVVERLRAAVMRGAAGDGYTLGEVADMMGAPKGSAMARVRDAVDSAIEQGWAEKVVFYRPDYFGRMRRTQGIRFIPGGKGK